jgi:hypothetical protein
MPGRAARKLHGDALVALIVDFQVVEEALNCFADGGSRPRLCETRDVSRVGSITRRLMVESIAIERARLKMRAASCL